VFRDNRRRRTLLWLQGQPLVPRRVRLAMLRRAGVQVGPGALVYPRVTVIGPRALRVGADSFLNLNCYVELQADVTIGDRASLADGVRLLTATHEIGAHDRRAGKLTSAPVAVGDGCWLGSGVRVLPGVSVAPGCVVAAGAVVASDTEPDGLYAGVPAQRVRDL
jgi:maltose O-acetyltransferase